MERVEPVKVEQKRVRRSAKHSKHGCGSCKIRRIKCDEARPVCSRCKSFGVTCDGYKSLALPSGPRPLAQAPLLLPKPKKGQQSKSPNLILMTPFERVMSSERIRKRPLESVISFNLIWMAPFETADEGKYYSLWCSKTVYEVLPYCQFSLHSSMLYGSCTQASIRYAVMAIAALHEAGMAARHARPQSLDQLGIVTSKHHRNAIEHYGKAIRILRRSVTSGVPDFRSTLVACFITFGFEAFHGNLALAVQQIRSGIALIEEWKQNYILHTAPEPDDEVIDTWICLEIQISTFLDVRPSEIHADLRTSSYASKIQNMPDAFSNMWEATKCFYIVKKRIDHFLHVARDLMERYTNHGGEDAADRERLLAEGKTYQAFHLAELDRWKAPYYPLLAIVDLNLNTAHDEDNISRELYLRIHLIHLTIVLKTVFATNEAVYDSYTAEFSDIVTFAFHMKEFTEGKSKTTSWTFDVGITMPLYFVASKCRIRSIRNRALRALERGPRREGIWDNLLLRDMAAWVQSIEEEFIEGDIVPVWARVMDLQYSFDLEHRVIEIRCQQRLDKGLNHKEKSTRIVW
ncbi:hypothetical protein N431DRAFT_490154 [Stipitochalara longipes BDJ]|nr:hypothetical protein N431DRAFT_490154 [Stipitochalara longipes BDJ]